MAIITIPTTQITTQKSALIVCQYNNWPLGSAIHFQLRLNNKIIFDATGIGACPQTEWGCSLHDVGTLTGLVLINDASVDVGMQLVTA